MTESSHESTAGPGDEEEGTNTPGTGNKDLTGQAREIVEAAEEGTTGPTPGGG